MTIQMRATEQYFHVVLFITLYKVVLTFEYVDEILKCDHSNESYWIALSCDSLHYHVESGSNSGYCGWKRVKKRSAASSPSTAARGCVRIRETMLPASRHHLIKWCERDLGFFTEGRGAEARFFIPAAQQTDTLLTKWLTGSQLTEDFSQ